MQAFVKAFAVFGKLLQGSANSFAGTFALVGGTKTITFPVAYNVAPSVVLTPLGAPGILGTTEIYLASVTTTGFTASSTAALDTRTIHWHAIGNPN